MRSEGASESKPEGVTVFTRPPRTAEQLFPQGYVEDCDEPRTKLGAFFSSRQKNAMLAYVTVELYWSVIPRS
jgi:hypothetical protein